MKPIQRTFPLTPRLQDRLQCAVIGADMRANFVPVTPNRPKIYIHFFAKIRDGPHTIDSGYRFTVEEVIEKQVVTVPAQPEV